MNKLILVFFLCFLPALLFSQQNSNRQQEIRKQMAEIRSSTDWDNPAAAKIANEKIKKLSEELMGMGSKQGNQGGQNQSGEGSGVSSDNPDPNQEMARQKMELFARIWELGLQGEGADFLVAEPIRNDIIEEYKQDDQQVINPVFSEQLSILVINLSMPGVESVIDAMVNFQGIKTLIIEAGDNPRMILLPDLMRNAKDYPLESLSIIDFKHQLATLPVEVYKFTKLQQFYLYNNGIKSLPPEIHELKVLRELYIDMNPISEIFPWITALKNLEVFGVAKTSISKSDLDNLRELLPNCEILEK